MYKTGTKRLISKFILKLDYFLFDHSRVEARSSEDTKATHVSQGHTHGSGGNAPDHGPTQVSITEVKLLAKGFGAEISWGNRWNDTDEI
jgi:hypothetical protein